MFAGIGANLTSPIRLRRPSGIFITLVKTGASVVELGLPDRHGNIQNVVLRLPNEAAYRANPAYVGCTVGRVANRLSGAVLTVDDECHALAANEGTTTLHGGPDHFGLRTWDVVHQSDDSATLKLTSLDKDQGFPGLVQSTVTYTLADDRVDICYEAVTDAPTYVNITNHAYFNLAAAGTVLHQYLQIFASRYTPVDQNLLPTGEILPVAGTPFDMRSAMEIQEGVTRRGRGFDENFVLDGPGGVAAVIFDPVSGRRLTISTDQPGLQLYTGQHLRPEISGHVAYQGLCLEPQMFPNAPNEGAFTASPLRPGETYRHRSSWAWSVVK